MLAERALTLMSERNQIKFRKCVRCGFGVTGKASELKEHGRECEKKQELAAAQAIMDKMKAELAAKPAGFVEMADERVTNAEGD